MNHQTIINDEYMVKSTNDLTFFKDSQVNRPIPLNKELKKILAEKGFSPFNPVKVKPDGVLCDGHCRIQYMREIVEKEGGDIRNSRFKVFFIVDTSGKEVAKCVRDDNTLAKPWGTNGYFVHLCACGLVPYIELGKCMNAVKDKTTPKSKREKNVLALGAATILATHGLFDAGRSKFKNGLMPFADYSFANKVADFIVKHQIYNYGKREFMNAINQWFTFYYNTLDLTKKRTFCEKIRNYKASTGGEASDMLNEWCRWTDIKAKSKKKIEELKERFVEEYNKTNEIPRVSFELP